MDVAALGVSVDSSGVVKGVKDLDRFTRAANDAGDEADRFGREAKRGGDGARRMGDETRKASGGVSALAASAKRLVGIMAAGFTFSVIAQEAKQFSTAMAEVSTLVDTAVYDMQALNKAALEQSSMFGTASTDQARALYQVISAGASSATEAVTTLDAANRLAIGGVTDVATAADGLTSVLNAYGNRVEGAAAVSDALFVAMRAGKTTIGELSSSLGKVAPLAAQAGVSFDELAASVSALTKGGISTQEAVTGVRAILAAVTKPSVEATKLAKQLGLEFNAAALEAQGFAKFMEVLNEKTGGSSEKLAVLFGGVEAIVPAMALAGQAGEFMTEILAGMENKAGETALAFEKMANSPGFQIGRLFANIKNEAIGLGTDLLTKLVPALRFLNENFETIIRVIGALVAGFATYKLAALGFAAVTTLMSGNLGIWIGAVATATTQVGVFAGAQVAASSAAAGLTAAVRTLFAALIANPFTAVAAAVGILVSAMIMLGNKTDEARAKNDALIASLKTLAQVRGAEFNARMAEAQMARNQARDELTRLEIQQQRRSRSPELAQRPGASAISGAASKRMQELRWEIVRLEGAINGANHVAQQSAKVADVQAAAAQSTAVASTKAAGATRANTAALTDAQKAYNDAKKSADEFISSLELEIAKIGLNEKALRQLEINRAAESAATKEQADRIRELGAAREKALAADEAAQAAAKKTEDHVRFMADFARETEIANVAIARQRGELGLTGAALDSYRMVTDKILQAMRDKIALTETDIEAIQRQAGETALAAETMENAFEQQRRAQERIKEGVASAREVVGGFFSSWYNGLREGVNIFKSFTDSVIGGLNRIIDKLLDRTIENFLDNLLGGSGGFLGGLLQGTGGGGGPVAYAAKGMAFNDNDVSRFAKGGAFTNSIVNTPTLFRFAKGGKIGEMGEAGPEAIMPLKRGSDGSLGVQMHGKAANNNTVNQTNNFNIGGVMTPEAIIAAIRQGGEETMDAVAKQLPQMMNEYQTNGAVAR
jgi:TP901 family phage tail tape measure protein|tara:strand:+ start:32258 stop:35284 length:3027 start_codon:yes stop_codon:yes gene_type:complete